MLATHFHQIPIMKSDSPMKTRYTWKSILLTQCLLVAGVGLALFLADAQARTMLRTELPGGEAFTPVPIPRETPIVISRPYNRPDWISNEDLAQVLDLTQPRFNRSKMKPNFVEHALRTWGVDATFQNPEVASGQEMLSFLTDNASFMDSWGKEVAPLLQERSKGIGIHWGTDPGASYHHDHLLACITEAGAPLNTPVFGPTRRSATLYDVIQESLRDFRLDERETEWTAMAFGLWIPPSREWIGSGGRQYSFDLLVDRLLRGEKKMGVCAGTHRVYSLLLLVRLDDEYDILSDNSRERAYQYLREVRDAITLAQFEDGHWSSDWPRGAEAVSSPVDEPEFRAVIATGHHLEWMSIAPQDLLIPDEQIQKGIQWIVTHTKSRSLKQIEDHFTFYSHVGAALCNWRQVRPADYWREWEATHPFDPAREASRKAPAVQEKSAPAAEPVKKETPDQAPSSETESAAQDTAPVTTEI